MAQDRLTKLLKAKGKTAKRSGLKKLIKTGVLRVGARPEPERPPARRAKKEEWSFKRLLASAKKVINPSGDRAKWRGRPANYASSTKRIPERSIPYKGTRSILLQFRHWGMTEERKVHRVHIQFFDLDVFSGAEATARQRDKNFFEVKFKGRRYMVEKPTVDTPVRVRCTCSDAYYRFNWYNYEQKAAFGGRPRPYERKTKDRPSVNPTEQVGACKHIVNSMLLMETSRLLRPGSRSFKSLSA